MTAAGSPPPLLRLLLLAAVVALESSVVSLVAAAAPGPQQPQPSFADKNGLNFLWKVLTGATSTATASSPPGDESSNGGGRAPPLLVVNTTLGPVKGFAKRGVRTWLSIPYAAPPVGALRFKDPQPAKNWTAPRDATKLSNVVACTQFSLAKKLTIGSEDCLYVNVWSPPDASTESPRPVMLWIYGGAFVLGDSLELDLYDGHRLARDAGVVVITFNYRLGVLGFYGHDGLAAETADGAVGNQGLKDQRAAMRWVQANAAAFGGDPKRVTIFGESAGGISVCYHLASPASRGLFHAAVIESGNCGSLDMWVSRQTQLELGQSFAERVSCVRDTVAAEVECLQNTEVDKLWRAQWYPAGYAGHNNGVLSPIMPWTPTIDGTPEGLQGTPLQVIQRGGSGFSRVPLILGSNKDEGTLFSWLSPLTDGDFHVPVDDADFLRCLHHMFHGNYTIAHAVMDKYPSKSYPGQNMRAAAIIRDYMFACDARRFARALHAAGAPPAWQYRFVYPTPLFGPLGTTHASELPFVWRHNVPVPELLSKKDWEMADVLMGYWRNLAATGDPNSAPEWARRSAGNSTGREDKGEEPAAAAAAALPRWGASQPEDNVMEMKLPPTMAGVDGGICDFWDVVSREQLGV